MLPHTAAVVDCRSRGIPIFEEVQIEVRSYRHEHNAWLREKTMVRVLLAFGMSLLLNGCAYLTTYQSGLGDPSTGVSMDAKQRMLIVNNVDGKRRNRQRPSKTCRAG